MLMRLTTKLNPVAAGKADCRALRKKYSRRNKPPGLVVLSLPVANKGFTSDRYLLQFTAAEFKAMVAEIMPQIAS